MRKIYLDNCCLNRPFDDQTQPRIHLESEAIKTILKLYEQQHWDIIISQVSIFELDNTLDINKKLKLQSIVHKIHSVISLSDVIIQKAKYFESRHIDSMDAMHLACAENHADIFLTVDDKLLKKAQLISLLSIEIMNPLTWLQKVL